MNYPREKPSDYPDHNASQKRTEPDLSFPQSVFDTAEPGIVDLRHLQGVDGQENLCPLVACISDLIRVSSMFFSSLKNYHLIEQ